MNSDDILDATKNLRGLIVSSKPNDRSEKDRRVAIVLTDLEKLEACITAWEIGEPSAG